LFDEHFRVLATGVNGVPAGAPHCNEDYRCTGASAPSGVSLELCKAIHAEQNALMQCADVTKIVYAFVTVSPCIHCMKMLLNTSCRSIYSGAIYDKEAANMWTEAGRKIVMVELKK
jgi:dCMP deaminase